MSEVLRAVQDWCHQALTAVREASTRAPGGAMTQALTVGALMGWLTYRLMKKRRRLPPGPRPLPLLGNLLWMGSKEEPFHVTLDRWAKENYGPVISVYMGPMLCVILNDFDTITEALVHKGADYAGRPFFHSVDLFTEGSKDIVFADPSPTWKLHRKIAVKAMRHYMTGSHIEKVVHEVVARVAEKMVGESGPFDPQLYNFALVFHVMDYICFGEQKSLDDPFIQRIFEVFDATTKEIGNGFYEDIIPLLKYWPTKSFRKVVSFSDELLEYFEKNIQKHRQRFSPDNVQDVTDSLLLAQMEAAREESSDVMTMFTDVHVRQTINDLFGAGVDTSRTILNWIVLYLAGHPQVQRRAQAEIDAVTGTEMPGLGHRSQLHYTTAVLQEVMRISPVVPLSLPHKTMCDTSVGGYDVPKGTMVMVNLWAVSHDPKLWDEPDKFKPQRFLDDQGQLKPLPKAWLPFSAGRRMCLGESVSRTELLLLLVCFLKRFTFSLPEGATFDPSPKVQSMLQIIPKPYQVVVTPR